MKTQNRKLAYKKSSVVELNDYHLSQINGGTTIIASPISVTITVSISVYTAGTFGVKN